MSKSNPLFVDSTKLHGDAIGTHIELRNVMVYDGEELLVVITTHQGIALRIPMKSQDDRNYEARVHLNHQKNISYQFVIERDGRVLLQSPSRRARAQYAIIEDWAPQLGDEVAPFVEVGSQPGTPAGVSPDWPREYAGTVKSLIDKWGL
jgi:hypothetical protein